MREEIQGQKSAAIGLKLSCLLSCLPWRLGGLGGSSLLLTRPRGRLILLRLLQNLEP